jgi:hypothetical protein
MMVNTSAASRHPPTQFEAIVWVRDSASLPVLFYQQLRALEMNAHLQLKLG